MNSHGQLLADHLLESSRLGHGMRHPIHQHLHVSQKDFPVRCSLLGRHASALDAVVAPAAAAAAAAAAAYAAAAFVAVVPTPAVAHAVFVSLKSLVQVER